MKLGEYAVRRTPHIIANALQGVDLSLRSAEQRHIEMVLGLLVGGNLNAAAKLLRVSRRCLERKGYRSPDHQETS